MPNQVIDYRLTWNPQTNQGRIEFRVAGNPQPITVAAETSIEFLIVAHLLEKAPVAFDEAAGWMITEPRPAGT